MSNELTSENETYYTDISTFIFFLQSLKAKYSLIYKPQKKQKQKKKTGIVQTSLYCVLTKSQPRKPLVRLFPLEFHF